MPGSCPSEGAPPEERRTCAARRLSRGSARRGFTESGIESGVYTITPPGQAATPTFSPPPGTYSSPQSVTLSYATPGAWILYWIVEDNPQWATTYTGPIDVSRTMTIAAYVYPLGNDAAIGAYVITGGSGL